VNIFNNIIKVGLLVVLLFSCNKEIDPKLMLSERYFVFGEVGTDLVYLTVWDLQERRYLDQTNCELIISTDGQQYSLPFRRENFWENLPLNPGQQYEIILLIDGNETRLAGQLPKSEETISIETEPYGEYANKFSLKIEGTHEPGEIYYRAYKNVPFLYLDEWLYTPGNYLSYTNKDSLLQDKVAFFNADSRMPIIHIVENRTYNVTCKKIKEDNLLPAYVDYSADLLRNEGNPLYIQAPFEEEVVIGDVVFRVLETTALTSIPLEIRDSTQVLMEVYLYNKDGLPLNDFQSGQVNFSLYDNLNGDSGRRKKYTNNPIQISLADLASIEKELPMSESELERLVLNETIFFGVATRLNHPTGDIIRADDSLTVKTFDDLYKVELRLR
jgi:hypothetical protein